MANLTLITIEDALLTMLRASATIGLLQSGGYCRTIESYGGQFELALDEVIVLYPCVFVAMAEEMISPLTHDGDAVVMPSTWIVLVADRNLRGNAAARRGDVRNPGAYQMMDDARNLLQGSALGLTNVDPLQLTKRTALLQQRDLAVYALEFTTQYFLD
jgi:phage gp37-like protein